MHLWIEASDEDGHKKVVHQQDFSFWVDPYAPTFDLEERDGLLSITAEDIGTPVDDLQMRWRVTGEAWAPWTQLESIPLMALNTCDIQVQLRDQAGNMSQEHHHRLCEPKVAELGFTLEEHQTRQAEIQAYGCQQTTPTFHVWTGLLALGFFVRRRRRMTGQG
jgi:hypothetical protein